MNNTERLAEIVALSKRVKSLAYESNLDLIGLMADMVLVESAQALYMALEQDEDVSRGPLQWEQGPEAGAYGSPGGQGSNVTQLGWYRDRKRAG